MPCRFGIAYRSRERPREHDLGVKVDILDFEGPMDSDVFIELTQAVELIFAYKDVLEDRKVKLIAIKLKKSALLWRENSKLIVQCEGRSKITT